MDKKQKAKKLKKPAKKAGKNDGNHSSPLVRQGLDRTPVGVPGFDKLIEGGLVSGSINLVCGDAGTSKSIFCMQFLVDGVEKYNEAGVYVSFEEKKENVYRQMKLFGWDLKKLEEKGKFIFLEYTPEQVSNVVQTGGGIISDVVLGINARRVVIDSLTAITLLYESRSSRRQALLELFDLIRKWECTALLISETSQTIGQHRTDMEEYEADGIILMYNELSHQQRDKYIEVYKMRGTKHANKIYKIMVNSKGITIEDSRKD